MTENQVLIIESWTGPHESGLLLVSKKPLTAKRLDHARIDLINKFQKTYKQPPYEGGMGDNPKFRRKLKRLLQKCLKKGFRLLEVGKFQID